MPVNVALYTVQAALKWQPTAVYVPPGGGMVVAWLNGAWTANPAWGFSVNGRGNLALPSAKPGYAMPGVPEGALVGLLQTTVFLIGNWTRIPPQLSGQLYLTINDDLDGKYGPGYTDNSGSLKVMMVSAT
jgi:hypothetical protein